MRNTMTKAKAERIAKKMVKRNISPFANAYTLAVNFNDNKLMSNAANRKVLAAFWQLVLTSPKYSAFDKMCIEMKLERIEKEKAT